jgi:Transcriptional regulators
MRVIRKRQATACLCLTIRRLTAGVTKYYDQVLAPCGVTANQYSVLLNISRAEHCSIRELADMAELDRSTLARNLKPLFNQGLVADTKEPGTRNSRLELTAAGQKTLECAGSLWAQAQERVKRKLGEEGQAALEKLVVSLEGL